MGVGLGSQRWKSEGLELGLVVTDGKVDGKELLVGLVAGYSSPERRRSKGPVFSSI